MNSSLRQPTILTILFTLVCVYTQSTTAMKNAKTLFQNCDFDPPFEYNSTSKFSVKAFNPIGRANWSYSFDVKDQTASFSHWNRTSQSTFYMAYFDYNTHTAELTCFNSNRSGNRFSSEKKLDESLALPSTFPPSDSVSCGESEHRDATVYSYYSKEYDFWFSIKVTGLGKCEMHEFGLPGQAKSTETCFKDGGDDFQTEWPVETFPSCW